MTAQLPGTPILTSIFGIIAIAVAIAAFNLVSIPVRNMEAWANYFDVKTMKFDNTTRAEDAWLDEFSSHLQYVPAPLGPLPCPQHVSSSSNVKNKVQDALVKAQDGNTDAAIAALEPLATGSKAHWLAVLSLSILHTQAGQHAEARTVLDRFLGSGTNQRNINALYDFRSNKPVSITIAGRKVRATEEHLRAFVHLSHNRGALWLQQGQYGRRALKILRKTVGLSKRLFSWGRNENDVQEAPIPAPGCPRSDKGLTTTGVYNNLIVGYLLSDTFKSSSASLRRETKRSYSDLPDKNPLYEPLIHYKDAVPQNWVWALSNAEHITHNIPTPKNPIISYNLATLMGSILERGYTPENVLKTKRMQFLETLKWEQVPDAEKALIMPSVIREYLAHNKPIPANMLENMNPQHAAIIGARKFAMSARDNLNRRQDLVDAIVAGDEAAIREGLGGHADAWLRGMRSDLAQHLAEQCLKVEEPLEKQRLADAITLFRRAGDAPVPTLALCRSSGGSIFSQIMPDWLATWEGNMFLSLLSAVIGMVLVALAWWWVQARLRQRNILFTNLYNIEALSL
ncbi:hypothetical protein TI05_00750 [Achromatium sp. WMS3]|nr:hypothetical protein TI05_00750 [Achromatium sp. WMS3]